MTVTAENGAATAGFKEKTLDAKADTAFTLVFDNQDASTGPHNVVINDAGGAAVAMGGDTAFFSGPEKRSYAVPALKAGSYTFVCQVHPSTMKGTLEVK